MQPTVWPHSLDDVWAKSAAKDEKQGESLAQHTWSVLERLADLQRLRPDLPQLVEIPELWHYLFWTCFLHDFGKSASGFQHMLHGGEPWRQRHEVLSLAFVNWIAPSLSEDAQRWVVAGIVSHHRDAKEIEKLYHDQADPDPLLEMVASISPSVVFGLWRWINECSTAWIEALGLNQAGVSSLTLIDSTSATALFEQQGAQHCRIRLQQYRRFTTKLTHPTARKTITFLTLLRGLTTTADHMASAHLDSVPPPIQESWAHLASRILDQGQQAYLHQQASAAASHQSAILIAPTGSGKTEAALYWALGDGSAPVPRLFYALPYQASMNAMFDRLKDAQKGFQETAVGLQHGRALQAMYARLIDQDYTAAQTANYADSAVPTSHGQPTPAQAAKQASWQKNMNQLHARPLKVFSPYQMLKAMFQLRGFEAMLTDYAQAAFVFDEIHAYDPKRLALILALVTYLREGYGARFFVMSATFPQLIRNKLAAALGIHAIIEADTAVFEKFRRHQLALLDGDLLETGIERIVQDVRADKQVLVCVNTVKRAQATRAALAAAGLPNEDLLLIHSRYMFGDRNQREKAIRNLCAVGLPNPRKPLALIATQVVEVSLNIDLDTIYSDPAPLEALLQRFGRVNRSGKKGICPVHVFRQPADGQGVYGRHKDKHQQGRIVQVTLAELEKHDGHMIDEAIINDWLNTIYADPQLNAQWEADYQQMAQQATQILRDLRPFNSDPQREEDFEQLFESVEVIPKDFEHAYLDRLAQNEFIEASNYLVSISQQKFAHLARQKKIRRADTEGRYGAWVALVAYDHERGLLLENDADAG